MIFGIIGNVYINTYTGILNNEEKCFEKLGFIKVAKNNNMITKNRIYKYTKIVSKIVKSFYVYISYSFYAFKEVIKRTDK